MEYIAIFLKILFWPFLFFMGYVILTKMASWSDNYKAEEQRKRDEERIQWKSQLELEKKQKDEIRNKEIEAELYRQKVIKYKEEELKRKQEEKKKKEKEAADKLKWEKYFAEKEIIEKRRRENPTEEDKRYLKNKEIFGVAKENPIFIQLQEELKDLEWNIKRCWPEDKVYYQKLYDEKFEESKEFLINMGYEIPLNNPVTN